MCEETSYVYISRGFVLFYVTYMVVIVIPILIGRFFCSEKLYTNVRDKYKVNKETVQSVKVENYDILETPNSSEIRRENESIVQIEKDAIDMKIR